MGYWNKFSLLMWKNWKLQSRRPIAFIIEVAIPLLVIAIFVLFRHNIRKRDTPAQIYDPFPISDRDVLSNVRYVYFALKINAIILEIE